MKKSVFIFICLGCLAFSTSSFAQENEAYDVLEISMIGGLGFPGGGITEWNNGLNAANGPNLGLDIGYFMKPSWIVGFNFTYHALDVDKPEVGGLKHRIYSPRLYTKLVKITESSFEPYMKAHIGLDNPKFATDVTNAKGDRYREISYDPAFAFGLTVGTFYFTSDYSGIFAEVQLHRALAEDATASYQGVTYNFGENYTSVDVNLGIRILIGSGE